MKDVWGEDGQLVTVARNVTTRYLAIASDALIGLLVLPFNVRHLGPSAWGLWMLTASITTYFSVLDLGYGGSMVKFVAQYRAQRDADALNEILSTLLVQFTIVGLVAYAVFVAVALNVTHVFNLAPDQVHAARILTLTIGVYVAAGFPFSVFGGVVNGFQRYDVNSIVGIASSTVVAVVNVVMLETGFSLVQLVVGTTAVRVLTLLLYRMNAYAVFPALSLSLRKFRRARLREVTSFSVYMAIIDWANKLNYSIDAIVIGSFLSSAAVALWTVPQRIAEVLQRLTNQVNGVLLPVVVDSDTTQQAERLRTVFVQGTRLSLVLVAPLGTGIVLLADPLIHAWVGPQFAPSVVITQILVAVIAVRVGTSTATTVLKGAGKHALLAYANGSTALANVALSLLWIRPYGLVGQAMGTLVPVAFTCVFVLWPAACRRVGLGVADAFARAVWPTLWPLAVMAAVVVPLRNALPPRLFAVALATGVGALCYFATFLVFAVKRDERRTYIAKATELARSRRSVAAAA